MSVSRFRVDDLTPLIVRTRDGGRTWTPITRGLATNAAVNVVREDPKTPGLLFAGTERDVYVSFNDGDDWQPLSLNLPKTSVRDLIVHGDDLAIATHGRGFWILDNMTPLRQLKSLQPSALSPAHLFKPPVAYRLRRDNWTDTPLPPEFPAARNPPDGAIIDYVLDGDGSGPVRLEILTATGALVRRFSSTDTAEAVDEKAFNVPMYWARSSQLLSATKGAHRFVWDLRYPAPGAVQRDFLDFGRAGRHADRTARRPRRPGIYIVS